MPLKPIIEFDVRGGLPADELAFKFMVAAARAQTDVGVPARITIDANQYRFDLSLAGVDADSVPGSTASDSISVLRGDPFARINSATAQWPIQGNALVAAMTSQMGGFSYKVVIQRGNANEIQAKAALDSFRREFEAVDVVEERFQGLPDDLRQFHVAQSRVFADERTELLRGHRELREAIADANQLAQAKIEQEQRKYSELVDSLRAEHEQKLVLLREERNSLETRKREFDDRARTHARRDHQKLLSEVIKKHESLKISESTKSRRWPVHVVCVGILLLAAALYLYVLFSWDGAAGPDSSISTYAVSILLTAGLLFTSTAVFYVRWLNEWFKTHAQSEIATKALEEDFVRSAWLVELLFEWSKENSGQPFPPEVLAALSRGLFTVDREAGSQVDHPVSEILSRFRSIREFEVDRKKIRISADPAGKEVG